MNRVDAIDSSLQKTYELLGHIEDDLGWQDRRHQSYSALRAVLHVLRDRLTIEDAVHFSAQLPLLLKGVFFDGWNINKVPVKMNRNEFISAIAKNAPFSAEGGIDEISGIVLRRLFETIDPGEREKIAGILPSDIIALFY